MIRKPILYYFISVYFFAVAIGFPIQISFIYDVNLFTNFGFVMSNLTSFNWICIVSLLAVSISELKYEHYLIPLSMIATSLIIVNNLLVGWVGSDFSINETLQASSLFVAPILSSLLLPSFRQALFNDRLHWWRQAPRMAASLAMKMTDNKSFTAPEYKSESINISLSGALIKTTAPLKIGEELCVWVQVENHQPISCQALVVREKVSRTDFGSNNEMNSHSNQETLKEFAIHFTDIDRTEQKRLEQVLAKKQNIAS